MFGSLAPEGETDEICLFLEVSTLEGGAAAHVVGLDPQQLVEPALRVEGNQTSSTVSIADVTGVRREGAEVTVSQPSRGALLPSWEISDIKLFSTRAVLNLWISV